MYIYWTYSEDRTLTQQSSGSEVRQNPGRCTWRTAAAATPSAPGPARTPPSPPGDASRSPVANVALPLTRGSAFLAVDTKRGAFIFWRRINRSSLSRAPYLYSAASPDLWPRTIQHHDRQDEGDKELIFSDIILFLKKMLFISKHDLNLKSDRTERVLHHQDRHHGGFDLNPLVLRVCGV